MDLLRERCAGLDIHKKSIAACRITPGAKGRPEKAFRTFGTMTSDLEDLAAWLKEAGVRDVAMEATGVYWQPIYNVLEDDFELLLANARQIKAVPGRKTDMRDCEWLADLHQHGLLKASFVPNRSERELRELTRYRTSVSDERSAHVNRLQKTLEAANIKLTSVASDVLGKSGRAMLEELVGGTVDAATLAQFARGTLRNKIPQLERALAGKFGGHQRFMVAQHLAHIDFLDAELAVLDEEVAQRTRPFDEALIRLATIPGVGRRASENILAEIGTDMRRFPTAGHLASWARMCPGTAESAGKHKVTGTGQGNPWLRRTLVQTAHAAGRSKTYLGAQFRRLGQRRGVKKAAIAVGHTQLRIVYHLLQVPSATYLDLGPDYFDRRDPEAVTRRLVRGLERLGYDVQLQPKAA